MKLRLVGKTCLKKRGMFRSLSAAESIQSQTNFSLQAIRHHQTTWFCPNNGAVTVFANFCCMCKFGERHEQSDLKYRN